MCYAAPGPRCSNHATQNLAKAKKNYAEQPNLDTRAALETAQQEYDTTPAGIKALRDAGKSLEADIAQERRTAQLKAYKQSNPKEDLLSEDRRPIGGDTKWVRGEVEALTNNNMEGRPYMEATGRLHTLLNMYGEKLTTSDLEALAEQYGDHTRPAVYKKLLSHPQASEWMLLSALENTPAKGEGQAILNTAAANPNLSRDVIEGFIADKTEGYVVDWDDDGNPIAWMGGEGLSSRFIEAFSHSPHYSSEGE